MEEPGIHRRPRDAGKSRAARALARVFQDLGLLTDGRLIEIAAADLAGATPRYTATQVAEVSQEPRRLPCC